MDWLLVIPFGLFASVFVLAAYLAVRSTHKR